MKRFAYTTLATAVLAGTVASAAIQINGAGATFPAPIYTKWFSEYNKLHSDVQINYQPIGSGGGINQIQHKTVFFGASDGPMTNEQIQAAGFPVLHFPTVLGGVVPVYEIPGVTAELRFTGAILADIYLGKITKWNAPEITAANKGVALPNKDILVVHRSDGSGTTYIFTDYLSAISPAWSSGPGKAKDVQWPVGLGGKGNDGVAGQVKQLPGSIGYIELAYARQNKLPYAALKNAAGKFIVPSIESITEAAAATAAKLPANTDFRVSIVNAPAADAYPIASFTYLLVSQTQPDPVKGKKLIDFIKWAIHDGEKDAAALDYGPLPKNVVAMLDKRLTMVKNIASK
jgi:phosphate transport system substrate-binding protein